MEGTTEPIIAVIGHPIAGNPTQLAVERALHAMNLDWRVLSFDVRPEDVAAAMEGFDVTGIIGVMIDESVAREASQWFASRQSDETDQDQQNPQLTENAPLEAVDCFYRDESRSLIAGYEGRVWVDQQIADHQGEHPIWFGDLLGQPISLGDLSAEPAPVPPSSAEIKKADLIVIARGADGPIDLETEDWPRDDGTTLVLCFGDHGDLPHELRQQGYRVLTSDDVRIATLQQCLVRWTGRDAPVDVIRDAIEEYFSV